MRNMTGNSVCGPRPIINFQLDFDSIASPRHVHNFANLSLINCNLSHASLQANQIYAISRMKIATNSASAASLPYSFSLLTLIISVFIPFLAAGVPGVLPKRRVVVALYDYKSRDESDLSFMKGDRMEVIDDTESDWWRVVNLTTRQEGLIPLNFVAEERSVNSEE